MPRKMKRFLIVLAVLVVAIQFVPIDRSNPPIGENINAPAAVTRILRESCYDCHSNETRWPWYAYVAPVSWMLSLHVHEGRDHLNFST
ncbi:MAG: heme-binding domain-containing protein, partial [bacterium]